MKKKEVQSEVLNICKSDNFYISSAFFGYLLIILSQYKYLGLARTIIFIMGLGMIIGYFIAMNIKQKISNINFY